MSLFGGYELGLIGEKGINVFAYNFSFKFRIEYFQMEMIKP